MNDSKLLIVGRPGSGKTHCLQELIAAHADDPTTTVWVITPYNELTGADRHAHLDGAGQMLTDLAAEVDRRRARGHEHTPTAIEPRIRLLIDRVEELRGDPLAGPLRRLAATGRKAAVDIVLTASTTHLDLWPADVRQYFDLPGSTETLPPRHHDEN